MMPYQQLVFKPGSKYSYSNPGFVYLARIIEQVTGDPWDDVRAEEHLLAARPGSELLPRARRTISPPHRSHNYYVARDSAPRRDSVIDNGADFDPGITSRTAAGTRR